MKKILCWFVAALAAVLVSGSLNVSALTEPPPKNCLEDLWNGEKVTASCLQEQRLDAIVIIEQTKFVRGASVHRSTLKLFVLQNNSVKQTLFSAVYTSRFGAMAEWFAILSAPITAGNDIFGYVVANQPEHEFIKGAVPSPKEGDAAMMHKYLGKKSTTACLAVEKFASMNRQIKAIQAKGGTVGFLVRNASKR